MRPLTCADVQALAPEVALGLLSGAERAEVYVHLQGCAGCRAVVDDMVGVVDDLLIAGPSVEPPPGFESGVLDRLAAVAPTPAPARPASTGRRRAARWMALAAAVVLVVVGVFLVGRRSSTTRVPEVRTASMVTPDGQRVGRVELGRNPRTVFLAVPGWKPWGTDKASYALRVTLDGGHTERLGPFPLTGSRTTWGSPARFDTTKVRKVAMVDAAGYVYCSATFT